MGSLFDSPITLVPVLLALLVIATIGVGVIVLVTHSTARQNQSRYEPPRTGQQTVPPAGGRKVSPGAPPWERQGDESSQQPDGGLTAAGSGRRSQRTPRPQQRGPGGPPRRGQAGPVGSQSST